MTNIENQKFDAIIVGSGPGGATVAKELSKENNNVLILEWGRDNKLTGKFLPSARIHFIPGRGLLVTNKMLFMIRGITTGGSSVVYTGTSWPPNYEMLKSYGIDISKEIKEVESELPYGPLPDNLIGPFAKRITASAQSLGYKWEKVPKVIYADKCKTDCDMCALGCPYGAKWEARMFVKEAIDNGATLLNHAKVKRVITDNKKAVGVEFSRRGRSYKVFAPKIIVAAGGIGTPVILRASGIKDAGYDFFFDPLILTMGAVDDVKGGKEIPMATGMHLVDDGIMMTDLTLPKMPYVLFTSEVFRFDRIFSHSSTLAIMSKVRDDLGGRITKRGGVRKKLQDSDMQKLNKGDDIARRILKNAGAKHIFKTWYIAAHPGGTAKINDIVDTNFQTEYENLYVCDCSVIPEAWGLPPTLTILGLGKRLAKHLVKDSAKEKAKIIKQKPVKERVG